MMKKSSLSSKIVAIILLFVFLMFPVGCQEKTTNNLPEINQEKYLLGFGELVYDVTEGGEKSVDSKWVADMDSAMGAKSQRVWMHLNTVLKRADDSNELSFKEEAVEDYHNYFRTLKEAGVERILVMNHQFLYPYGYEASTSQVALDPIEDAYFYEEWIQLFYDCYVMLATEFPEVNFWEPGNEHNLPTYLHKNGGTGSHTDLAHMYSMEEAAWITADVCYAANKAIKSVNPDNVLVLPGVCMDTAYAENGLLYLEGLYDAIGSKTLPTLEDHYMCDADDYFDILAWHPYCYSVEEFIQYTSAAYEIAKNNGDSEKIVWFTEIGFSEDRFTQYGDIGSKENQDMVAELAIGVFDAIKDEMPYVETCFWFRMSNCYFYPINSYENNFGIFYSPDDPVNRGKPKPIAIEMFKYFNGEDADISILYSYSSQFGIVN